MLRQVMSADTAKLPVYIGVPLPDAGYALIRISKVIDEPVKEGDPQVSARRSSSAARSTKPTSRACAPKPTSRSPEPRSEVTTLRCGSRDSGDDVAEARVNAENLAGHRGRQIG